MIPNVAVCQSDVGESAYGPGGPSFCAKYPSGQEELRAG